MRRTTNNDIILCEEKEDLPMKKHPVIHYILILVLSGSFGALLITRKVILSDDAQ